MNSAYNQTPKTGQSQQNNLVDTPEHLRPGFRRGQQPVRQYDPSEFGLTGNEEWRDPRMFRNLTYETNAEAVAQQRQARYCPPTTPNVSNLAEGGEYIGDISPPPHMGDTETSENSVYRQVVHSFKKQQGDNLLDPISIEVDVCGTQQQSSVHTTHRKVTTHRDQSGNITSHVEETSTLSNSPCKELDCTPVGVTKQGGRHLQFSVPEQLDDISMPSFNDISMPAMSTRMPNECLSDLDDITAPSFPNSTDPRARSEYLENMSMPSGVCGTSGNSQRQATAYTNELLSNVTMPSFGDVSGVSHRSPHRQERSMSPQQKFDTAALDDISVPSFTEVSGAPSKAPTRYQHTMPSQNIADITAPSFQSSGRSPMNSGRGPASHEYIEDFSMPSFAEVSGSSRAKSPAYQQRSMPTENIGDISAPTFESSSRGPMTAERGPMTNELLEDVTMPSFGGVSGSSRARAQKTQQRSLPSQNICDTSAPSFGSSGRSQMNSERGRTTDEFLEDVTMPSFGGVSGASKARAQTHQQRSLPSQNICDTSAPSFGSSGRSPMNSERGHTTNEFLEDVTMPSFGGVSGSSRARAQTNQQSIPSQNICDTSAPSFASSGRSPMNSDRGPSTNEFLEDVTMPSFAGVSGSSRARAQTNQQRSLASQNVCDTSAPSFGRSGRSGRSPMNSDRGPSTNEFLEDVTMPSFGGVSGASRSRAQRNKQRSMQSQNICDTSAPSFGRSGRSPMNSDRGPMTHEFIEDVTMPSFAGVSGSSRARAQKNLQRSMPSQNICDISAPSFGSSGRSHMNSERGHTTNEFLEDVTMPSFGGVSGSSRARAQTHQHRSLPSQNICDTSAPSFGRSGRSPMNSDRGPTTNEFLEDITMPSFAGVSGSSRARAQKNQQRSLPSQNICDTSAPSFGSSGRSAMNSDRGPTTNEFLEDVTMPSFEEFSGDLKERTQEYQQRSIQSQSVRDILAPSFESTGRDCITVERLENITMPSFESTGRGPMSTDYLENISMPSYEGVSSTSRPRSPKYQQRSLPSQNICDTSAPSFGSSGRSPMNSDRGPTTNEFLEDVTMPSFGGVSGSSRARAQSHQQRSLPSQNICDTSAPSFGRSGRSGRSTMNSNRGPSTNEFLEDVTMPSFAGVSGSSRARAQKTQQRSLPSQNICDTSAPSFGSSGRSPMNSDRGLSTNEFLEDVTMPSFGGVSGSSRARAQTHQQRSLPSQNICDTSAPSFGYSGRSHISNSYRRRSSNDCIEDVTMPSFGDVSGVSRARTPTRQQQMMQSQNICDTSAPSFGSSGRGLTTNEYLEDVAMPSFKGVSGSSRRQETLPSERLDDITAPSYRSGTSRSRSTRRQQIESQNMYKSGQAPYCSEFLEDVSMPSFAASGASRGRPPTRNQQSMPFQATNNTYLDDVTMPSFGGVSGSSRKYPMRSLSQGAKPRRQLFMSYGFSNSDRREQPNECLENVTMPSFGGISGAASSRRGRTQNTTQPTGVDTFSSRSGNQRRPRPKSSKRIEYLDDESVPTFDTSSNVTRNRNQFPNFTSEYLTDVSMNSMQSGSSPRRVQSFPCVPSQQNIGDITAPLLVSPTHEYYYSFENSRIVKRGAADVSYPSEMLGNQSAPSYYHTPNRSTLSRPFARDPTLKSFRTTNENINNISEPSMLYNNSTQGNDNNISSTMGQSLNRAQSKRVQPNSGRQIIPASDQISYKSQRSQSGPCTVEVKQVTVTSSVMSCNYPNGVDSRDRTPQTGQKVFQNIENSQNIEDISMPAFESTAASIPRNSNQNRGKTQNIDDISMPAYESTGASSSRNANQSRGNTQNIDDISMPAFESTGVSLPKNSQQSRGNTQNIDDISMPAYESTGASSSRNANQSRGNTQNIEEISMPAFESTAASTPRNSNQNRGNTQNIDDISMPAYESTGASSSRNANQSKGNTQNIDDISMPAYESMGASLPKNSQQSRGNTQNIDDISMPAFESTGASSSRNANQSRGNTQNIDDISMPAYESMGASLPKNSQQSRGNTQKIEDTSMPAYESTGDRSTRNAQQTKENSQNIDDISMPTFESTGVSSTRSPQQTKGNSQNIDDISMPAYESTGVSSMGNAYQAKENSQNIDDISMPTYRSAGVSSQRNANQTRENTQNIDDISMPTYASVDLSSIQSCGPTSRCRSQQRDNTNDPSSPNETFHGFDSMDNYAPFEDLVNNSSQQTEMRTQLSNETDASQTLPSPEPVRGERKRNPQDQCYCSYENGRTQNRSRDRQQPR